MLWALYCSDFIIIWRISSEMNSVSNNIIQLISSFILFPATAKLWYISECLGDQLELELESENGSWYCTSCKADCGLCSGAVLYSHKAVQCDKCEMWIHNECSLITESEFDSVENTNCTWIFPKCDFFFTFRTHFSQIN